MAKESSETPGGGDKGDKPPRGPGQRAMASLRSAKRIQNDVSDPVERSRILLAEANVLALLDLADALRANGDAEKG